MNKSFIAALFLLIAALFFSSCGGTSKSTEEKVEEQTEVASEVAGDAKQKIEEAADAVKDVVKEGADATKQETKDAVAEASSKVLAGYETLVNKVLPLAEKVKKGDIKAIADYTKQSKEIKDYVSKNATELTGLTGEDAKKYKELGESLINSFKK